MTSARAGALLLVAVGLSCVACRWGAALRDESANRFAPVPSEVAFRDCTMDDPAKLPPIEMEPG